jgi:hypothetical protein
VCSDKSVESRMITEGFNVFVCCIAVMRNEEFILNVFNYVLYVNAIYDEIVINMRQLF